MGQSSAMDYSIFVGDLGGDVTESLLLQVFQAKYRSVKSARIVTDPVTGVSKSKITIIPARKSKQSLKIDK
jgi:RNA recognition motif-containing protein